MKQIFKILCVLMLTIYATHSWAQNHNTNRSYVTAAVSGNYKLKLFSLPKHNEISFSLFSLHNRARLFCKTTGKVVVYFGDDSKMTIKLKNDRGILKANVEQWDAKNNKCVVKIEINGKTHVFTFNPNLKN